MKHIYYLFLANLIFSCSQLICAERIRNDEQIALERENQLDTPRKQGDPLRILFVTSSFPRFDQQFILNMICKAMDLGHDVYIAATRPAKEGIVPAVVHQYKLLDRTLFFGRKNPLKLLQQNRFVPEGWAESQEDDEDEDDDDDWDDDEDEDDDEDDEDELDDEDPDDRVQY